MKRYVPILSAAIVPAFVGAASYVLCATGQLIGPRIFLLG